MPYKIWNKKDIEARVKKRQEKLRLEEIQKLKGKDGKDGVSIAGKDGISIKGDPGPPGKDGLSIKGDKGDSGRPGIAGKDGKDGKNGKDGLSGRDGISIGNSLPIGGAIGQFLVKSDSARSGLAKWIDGKDGISGLTTSNFASPNVSQWINDAGYLTSAGAINHDDLAGLQGGAAGEYYHLTNTQHTNLTSTAPIFLGTNFTAIPESGVTGLITDLAAKQSTTLTNTHILVGNASNIATDVAMSGDATIANTGILTLVTVNSNVGTFGSATQSAVPILDAKGRITAISNVTITPAASSITGGAALTRTNDTNVTLTLGGTPSTSLLAATSLTLGWTGTLAATRGGTGLSTFGIGSLIYADSTSTLAQIASAATGKVLLTGGVNVDPFYGKVGLTTHVSGTLAVGNGGTGITAGTSGGLLYLSSASTIASSGAYDAGAVLFGNGAGNAPSSDSSKFFWHAGTGSLRIGTNTQYLTELLTVYGNDVIFYPAAATNAVMRFTTAGAFGGGYTGTAIAAINNTGGAFTDLTVSAANIHFYSGASEMATLNAAGSFIVGNSSSALATNATGGFLYIPTCAGTPTGTPTAITGVKPMVYDTSNNKLYVYNGAWKGIILV